MFLRFQPDLTQPGCTATKDGERLEISDLGSSLCSENKGPDQLHVYRAADPHLCFWHMQKAGFLMTPLICLKVSL